MPWGRLDDQLYDNGKTLSFSDKAFRLWMHSISYACRHKTGGTLSQEQADYLARGIKASSKTIAELVEKRGWHATDSGYAIHDFDHYNGHKVDTTVGERVKRYRASRNGDVTAVETLEVMAPVTVVTPDVTPLQSVTVTLPTRVHAAGPVPNPNPVPIPDHEPYTDQGPAEIPSLGVPESMPAPHGAAKPKPNGYTPDFEHFWSIYPRRIEKQPAFQAWRRNLKIGTEPGEMIQAARHFAEYVEAEGTEDRFVPHPATWLGPQGKWRGYRDGPPRPSTPTRATPRRTLTAFDRTVANFRDAFGGDCEPAAGAADDGDALVGVPIVGDSRRDTADLRPLPAGHSVA